MLRLSIRPLAESDLVAIWAYTCDTWGVEQADAYLDRLGSGMNQLCGHPKLGADYGHVRPGYRRLNIGHHAVLYQVLEADVVVVRVLHEEMDVPNQPIK